jgi:hypothetical protein
MKGRSRRPGEAKELILVSSLLKKVKGTGDGEKDGDMKLRPISALFSIP